MDDLLQSQIKDSCKLALPDGLKDLMSDISREVLRAQPRNLYQFITQYLSALLVTRENLCIADRVCDNVCVSACHPELEDELRYIGLNDEDAAKAKDVIIKYFENDEVKEGNLLIKLMKKTSLNGDQLPAVQEAVRKAFQRHLINNTTLYQSSSNSEDDEITQAASHTLQLYRKSKPTDSEYNRMTQKIQTSYRAYGVRRACTERKTKITQNKIEKKNIRFFSEHIEPDIASIQSKHNICTISSSSLAGSHLSLPKYKPYSVHDTIRLGELDETAEKESNIIDYLDNTVVTEDGDLQHREDLNVKIKACNNEVKAIKNKPNKIYGLDVFQEVVEVDDEATDVDDESEDSVEEIFVKQCESDDDYN